MLNAFENVGRYSFFLILFGTGLSVIGAFSIIYPILVSDALVRAFTIVALGFLFIFEGLRWPKTVKDYEKENK